MNDPIAYMSVETPILTTKQYIVYHIHNYMYNYDAYSLNEKNTGDCIVYGTLQECFDYIAKGYNI